MGFKKAKVNVPEGMFVFSKIMKSKKDLSLWEKHFRDKSIKTEIVEVEGGFVLCREGIEARA